MGGGVEIGISCITVPHLITGGQKHTQTRTGSCPLPVKFASRDLITNNIRDNVSVLTSDLVDIKFIARLYADNAMTTDL